MNSRLYPHFQPRHYDLRVDLQREQRQWNGTVAIRGVLASTDHQITLHAHELRIISAAVDGRAARVEMGDGIIRLSQDGLRPGEHTIEITFEGTITDPMHGLYPCYFTLDGQKEELLATQFESHHAREVFPCIDEPEAKATFGLTLMTEADITVIANTPVKQQHRRGNHLTTAFETTPVMSTYLLAWVVGKLDYTEAKTKGGTTVRTYATPDKKPQLGFALQTAVRVLEFFNNYFAIDYPLPKCDLVALPDFSAGAMENWGCITFRERIMLADEHTATSTKQYIAIVVAHELAHQWFGNLVTMKWWNDLWLNESFAIWAEYLAVDALYPEWHVWTQYYELETTRAIQRDSLPSVQPVRQDVSTPDEINSLFDPAIVYAKGGNLLRMLHDHIGADVFRDGLRQYMRHHQYSNTEADDLWDALGGPAKKNVADFMHPWITKPGLPVVSVDGEGTAVSLRQQRFLGSPQIFASEDPVWPIPLFADGQIDKKVLTTAQGTLTLQPDGKPLLINRGRSGYYMCQYDAWHSGQLANAVRGGSIPAIDRLGLLNDNLNLSRAGRQPFIEALHLLEAYQHESDQTVWGAIGHYFAALEMFAEGDGVLLAAQRRFVLDMARRQYQRLGWKKTPGESYFDELLRPRIITHMAHGEDPTVVAKLQAMFQDAKAPADIDSDIRSTVFAIAARFGGEQVFERLHEWYLETTSAEARVHLTIGMASVRGQEAIAHALAMLTTKDVKLQDLFYWIIYLLRNHDAKEPTWQWIQDQWGWIEKRFGRDLHYTDFTKYPAAAFSTAAQLASYRAFFEPKLATPALTRTIRQGIEDINSRVLWRERDGQAAADYLHTYTSSTQAVTEKSAPPTSTTANR